MAQDLKALLAVNETEKALIAWAMVRQQRDELIRAAHELGISTARIAKLSGLSLSTVLRVLHKKHS